MIRAFFRLPDGHIEVATFSRVPCVGEIVRVTHLISQDLVVRQVEWHITASRGNDNGTLYDSCPTIILEAKPT